MPEKDAHIGLTRLEIMAGNFTLGGWADGLRGMDRERHNVLMFYKVPSADRKSLCSMGFASKSSPKTRAKTWSACSEARF